MVVILLTFGPLAIMIFAWKLFLRMRDSEITIIPALLALSIVSANVMFAAYTWIRYSLFPPDPTLPPWKDPRMIVAAAAGVLGASKKLVLLMEIASLPLLLLGVLVGIHD